MPETFPKSIRLLWLRLTVVWAIAWLLGLLAFGIATFILTSRFYDEQIETRLRIQAIAVYGLAFFNEQGDFESELLKYEDELFDADTSVWFVEPGHNPIVHLGKDDDRIAISHLAVIAGDVVRTDADVPQTGFDTRGNPVQVLAIPTYEVTSETPRAAIIVATNPQSTSRAKWLFLIGTLMLILVLGFIGILVGALLARWSLNPLARFISQREQFVSAAAHELRTPLAAINAVIESAGAGNEPPAEALRRLDPLVSRATRGMEDLLLYARLDAGKHLLEQQPIRLDLLVEACLPETGEIEFQAAETIVIGDHRLLKTAVSNLLTNALRHAKSPAGIRVHVANKSITIENDGDEFSTELIVTSSQPFTVAPSTTGSGLGLAIVQMIVKLHGGHVTFENRNESGIENRAWVSIQLP